MPLDSPRATSLFSAALEIPDPHERMAFLDRECGMDDELRNQIVKLLASANPRDVPNQSMASTRSLDTEFFDTAARADRVGEELGTLPAGKYQLRQVIGEGGMGSVYLADQLHPLKRRVAIKVIRAGMDSARVLAQFEAERQVLALMNHPHIAKVLDAGSTDQGRPFFVMEFVNGVPLTTYCDQRQLGMPDRLNLFVQLCAALQHAHQKGVIHRDLKPSNILVEDHDGVAVPKVIDFGLAKATSGMHLTEHTITAVGQVAGTPLYMAPEQASFGALDVDTRADVYALGVVLYELLTGSTPIERQKIEGLALDEALRIIREEEPPTPSSRLSSLNVKETVAEVRQTDPTRLGRFVRGDLDWIVMKTLSKERDGRYETATALARDIERFLNHEPVQAGPPSALYKLRKFARRNRLQVIAGSFVLLALLAGITGTSLGLVWAMRAAHDAKAAEQRASNGEQAERKAREQADEISAFMRNVFAQSSAYGQNTLVRPGKRNLTVKEAMDYAASQLNGQFPDRPEIEAALRDTIGNTYRELAEFKEAEFHLKKAIELCETNFGLDDPRTLASVSNLAGTYEGKGDFDSAERLHVRTLVGNEKAHGPDARPTLESANNLAAIHKSRGDFRVAEDLYNRALIGRNRTLGPNDPDTIQSLNNLGLLLLEKGQVAEAEELVQRALNACKTHLGEDHPNTLASANNLAGVHFTKQEFVKAEELFMGALAARERVLGPNHPETLTTVDNLGQLYQACGKPEAERYLRRAFTERQSVLGPLHYQTIQSTNNLGMYYLTNGNFTDAKPLLEQALQSNLENLGADHPATLSVLHNLGGLYYSQRIFSEALPRFKETLQGRIARLGDDHHDTMLTRLYVGMTLGDLNRFQEAIPYLEQAFHASRQNPLMQRAALPLIVATWSERDRNRAAQVADELLTRFPDHADAKNPNFAGVLLETGQDQLNKDSALAERLLRSALASLETLAPRAWQTAAAKSMLGRALQLQQKLDEAEPLLVASQADLKSGKFIILPRERSNLVATTRWLAELYEATDRLDQAAQLRKELPTESPGEP